MQRLGIPVIILFAGLCVIASAMPAMTSESPADKGVMKEFSLYSNANSQAFSYYVVLPGAAVPGEHYPVLLLLHGAFEHHTVWKDRAKALLIEQAARHRLIIVLPDGEPFGWYADSLQPGRKSNQIETFLIKELLPDVAQRVPEADFQRIGIGGISMGGHGAFTLTIRNPGLFRCVSSMSGILDITRHPKSWELPDVFGPLAANRTVWEAHSAYVTRQKKSGPPEEPSPF